MRDTKLTRAQELEICQLWAGGMTQSALCKKFVKAEGDIQINGVSSRKGRKMENSIGEKIRTEREKRKMSQGTLAERLGISQQAVHAYEKGMRKPKLEKLIRISVALNVPVELFLPDELNENEMVRKIKEEYDRGYQAGREAMKKELMEHMQIWLSKKEEK